MINIFYATLSSIVSVLVDSCCSKTSNSNNYSRIRGDSHGELCMFITEFTRWLFGISNTECVAPKWNAPSYVNTDMHTYVLFSTTFKQRIEQYC